MLLRIACVVVLSACSSRPAGHSPAARPAWHIAVQETPYGNTGEHYVVNIALVPPDGSPAIQLNEFASRTPCVKGSEVNGYCARLASAPDDPEWRVTCGDTRMHVVLDLAHDQLTVGSSNAKTDFCAITTGSRTLPARGGVALAVLPWGLADGIHPPP
jgi:hypothetical protein